MNIDKRKSGLLSAGLVIAVAVLLLGVIVSSGGWYAIVVMATAGVWFAAIAATDRPLTAGEKRVRADLRRIRP